MISIIVPVYNKKDTIKRCIDSILSQSYKNFEIIIIDDGSTDGSVNIIKSINDERIRYYYQKNSGVASARNLGIKKSLGDYITFLDADDEWNPKFLEKMILAVNNSDICYCGHYVKTKIKQFPIRFHFTSKKLLTYYLCNKCTPNTNSWLIDRKIIMGNKILFQEDKNWGEDMLFFLNVIICSKNISYVNENLTFYNIDVKNNLSTNRLSKIDQDLKWMNEAKILIQNKCLDKKNVRKYLEIIDSYRIPAAIIYRLNSNLDLLNYKELKSYINEYYFSLKKINLCNGLRSFKLILLFLKLYLFLWGKKK